MLLQRLAVVMGGFAAGALLRRWQGDTLVPHSSLEKTVRDLRTLVHAHEYQIGQLEKRLEVHAAKLKEIPTITQLNSAIDELLTKAMAGLDVRLAAQAQSIETLQMTVAQTDELLERVLESLDTLPHE